MDIAVAQAAARLEDLRVTRSELILSVHLSHRDASLEPVRLTMEPRDEIWRERRDVLAASMESGKRGTRATFIVPIARVAEHPKPASIVTTYIDLRVVLGGKPVRIAVPAEMELGSADAGLRTVVVGRTRYDNLLFRNQRTTGLLVDTPSGSLRVMIFASQVSFGGGKTKALFHLARHLRDSGHQVCVTALISTNVEPSHRFPDGIGFDFIDGSYRASQAEFPEGLTTGANKRATASTDEKLANYLRQNRFDLIYVPNFDSGLYKIIKANVPPDTALVLGDHNPHRPHSILDGTINPDFVWGAREFDAVHVVNPLIGELVKRIEPRDVFTIPNVSGLKAFTKRDADFLGTRKMISVGRLVRTKRMDHVIKAFARTAADHPDWQLDIFGSGEEESALRQLVTDLGMEARIALRGFDPAVVDVLRQGAVVVSGSSAEAHPLTLIEAMGAGCLVISYDRQYGAKYLIRDQVNGFLAADGSVKALAQVMDKVMTRVERKDASLLAVLSQATEDMHEFDDERIRALWDDKVRSLVARKRPPAAAAPSEPAASGPVASVASDVAV